MSDVIERTIFCPSKPCSNASSIYSYLREALERFTECPIRIKKSRGGSGTVSTTPIYDHSVMADLYLNPQREGAFVKLVLTGLEEDVSECNEKMGDLLDPLTH